MELGPFRGYTCVGYSHQGGMERPYTISWTGHRKVGTAAMRTAEGFCRGRT